MKNSAQLISVKKIIKSTKNCSGVSSGLLLICAIVMSSSSSFAAGGRDGNGGDAIVCRNGSGQVTSAELLDYYEGRVLRNVALDLGPATLPYPDKIQLAFNRLAKISPIRASTYQQEYSSFMADSQFIAGVQLVLIPDAEPTVVPTGCNIEQLAVQKDPQFPGDKRFTISQDLWDKLDNNNRAGLILHEIIYREAIGYGQENSLNVRYFNAFISSPNLINTLGTQKQIFDLMSLIHFQQTDFYGVRFTVDSSYSMAFYPSGAFQTGTVAFPNKDSVLIENQQLPVTSIAFFESGKVGQISSSTSYKDPYSKITFQAPLQFSESGRVLIGNAMPFTHAGDQIQLSGYTVFDQNGNVISSVAQPFVHPVSKLHLGGNTYFDAQGHITRSELDPSVLSGKNYQIAFDLLWDPVDLDLAGDILKVEDYGFDSEKSWISVGSTQIVIENKILGSGYDNTAEPLVFSNNGLLISGFIAQYTTTYTVSIQGSPVIGSGEFRIRDDGGILMMGIAIKQRSLQLKVGNQTFEINAGKPYGNERDYDTITSISFFNMPGDVVESLTLSENMTLPLATGGKKKFFGGTVIHFNQQGLVTGSN